MMGFSFSLLISVMESSSSFGFLGTGFIVAPSTVQARQKLATILRHHCHPRELSKAVTTGAKTIVPNPEPQVEIPVTKDLFFSNQ